MTDNAHPRMTSEQLAADVGAVVREVPGVVDLHRNPLQVLGERVRLDWYGPVRFAGNEDTPFLEVHIVVGEGCRIPEVADAARRAVEDFVARELPACAGVRLFVDDIVESRDLSREGERDGRST